ncbi:hypothetical protein DFP72DRAFT_857735 [Ephemerocybe angulata]|uniref:NYN domain-containing protein n=1 Tax=Ephemerocybe angulata TaxID=980116 RepID=A0A8H6LUF6_9AGAR|nr:hypothetical protein DFP72DRAFT_857735 [Tulosesus angulatus]
MHLPLQRPNVFLIWDFNDSCALPYTDLASKGTLRRLKETASLYGRVASTWAYTHSTHEYLPKKSYMDKAGVKFTLCDKHPMEDAITADLRRTSKITERLQTIVILTKNDDLLKTLLDNPHTKGLGIVRIPGVTASPWVYRRFNNGLASQRTPTPRTPPSQSHWSTSSNTSLTNPNPNPSQTPPSPAAKAENPAMLSLSCDDARIKRLTMLQDPTTTSERDPKTNEIRVTLSISFRLQLVD